MTTRRTVYPRKQWRHVALDGETLVRRFVAEVSAGSAPDYRAREGLGPETSETVWVAEGRKLGRMGWTIPMNQPALLVGEVLEKVGDSQIDAFFVHLYTRERGKLLSALMKYLLAHQGLRPWRRLIRESRFAYSRRKYQLVVPALLAVLEGFLATKGQALATRRMPRDIAKRERGANHRSGGWASIQAFVDNLFGNAPFSASHPGSLNRHWILHGRDAGPWNQADCLRLYQAIHTIAKVKRGAA